MSFDFVAFAFVLIALVGVEHDYQLYINIIPNVDKIIID